MLVCLLASELSDPALDVVIESVHCCTPLISVPLRGRIFCGLDDLAGLHALVQGKGLRAAMAPTRNDALLHAIGSHPGRIDAHEHAGEVRVDVLTHLDELGLMPEDTDRLRLFGLDTIAALRRLEERHLRLQFGYRAAALYRFLHEADSGPLPMYVPPAEVLCRERFEEDEREPGPILAAAQKAAAAGVALLEGRQTWRIEVGIMNAADKVICAQSRILRQGTTQLRTLLTHVNALCRRLLAARHRWRGLRLRLASLRNPEGEQMALFAARNSRTEMLELLRPRYASVIKRIEIIDPWSILPERYSRIVALGPVLPADDGERP